MHQVGVSPDVPPPADPTADGDIPKGVPPKNSRWVIVTVMVLAVLTAVVGAVVIITSGNDGGEVHTDQTEDVTPSTDPTTVTTITTTTSTSSTTTTTTPSATTTTIPTAVLSEPAGLYCRDLAAKGYSYPEAMLYWEHNGWPENMDASGLGIPCQSVYDREDVIDYWGEAAERQPVNLNHPLLSGYATNERNILESRASTGSAAAIYRQELAADLNRLDSITSAQWDETRLIALGASFCNDWGSGQDRMLPGAAQKWAAAIGPVLGISVPDALAAINSNIWRDYQMLCG